MNKKIIGYDAYDSMLLMLDVTTFAIRWNYEITYSSATLTTFVSVCSVTGGV